MTRIYRPLTCLILSAASLVPAQSIADELVPAAPNASVATAVPVSRWILDVRLNHNDGIYYIGDRLTLDVTTPRAGYLHVINITPKGDFSVLWPMDGNTPPEVQAHTQVSFPDRVNHPGVIFEAAPPVGRELIVCFATTSQLNLHNEEDARMLRSYLSGIDRSSKDPLVNLRDFVTRIEPSESNWTVATVHVETRMAESVSDGQTAMPSAANNPAEPEPVPEATAVPAEPDPAPEGPAVPAEPEPAPEAPAVPAEPDPAPEAPAEPAEPEPAPEAPSEPAEPEPAPEAPAEPAEPDPAPEAPAEPVEPDPAPEAPAVPAEPEPVPEAPAVPAEPEPAPEAPAEPAEPEPAPEAPSEPAEPDPAPEAPAEPAEPDPAPEAPSEPAELDSAPEAPAEPDLPVDGLPQEFFSENGCLSITFPQGIDERSREMTIVEGSQVISIFGKKTTGDGSMLAIHSNFTDCDTPEINTSMLLEFIKADVQKEYKIDESQFASVFQGRLRGFSYEFCTSASIRVKGSVLIDPVRSNMLHVVICGSDAMLNGRDAQEFLGSIRIN